MAAMRQIFETVLSIQRGPLGATQTEKGQTTRNDRLIGETLDKEAPLEFHSRFLLAGDGVAAHLALMDFWVLLTRRKRQPIETIYEYHSTATLAACQRAAT